MLFPCQVTSPQNLTAILRASTKLHRKVMQLPLVTEPCLRESEASRPPPSMNKPIMTSNMLMEMEFGDALDFTRA